MLEPLRFARLEAVLEDHHHIHVGLLQSIDAAVRILGPWRARPGPVPLALGLFVLNGLSFFAAAALELMMRFSHATDRPQVAGSVVAEARQAWTFLRNHSQLRVLMGLALVLQNVPLFSHFQVAVPAELRGKLMGMFQSAMLLVLPGSMWLMGELLGRVSWPLLPLGAAVIVAGAAAVAALHPGLRRMGRAPAVEQAPAGPAVPGG